MNDTVLNKILLLILGGLLVTACSSKGGDVNEGESEPTAVEEQADQDSADAEAQKEAERLEAERLEAEAKAQAELFEKTVFYFDFDDSTIREESKELLKAHAAYINNSPSASVMLEGHADERGTVEYNVALGERRAVSVRRFLMANGVNSDQIQVTSFGEEQPVAFGQDEASWSKNRRVEIKYQSR